MTKNHEVPAYAFREDRGRTEAGGIPMLHDIEPAPVTDHQTIEQRLSRLEAFAKDLQAQINVVRRPAWMDGLPPDPETALIHKVMDSTCEADYMDDPDPEPVTAGNDAWAKVAAAALMMPVETFRTLPQMTQDGCIDCNKQAVDRAIELGLAVSPDDPRLQPLEVTDELVHQGCNLAWHMDERRVRLLLGHAAAYWNQKRGLA